MEQANLEAAERFQKNNGMAVDEAYKHVKTWYKEGKYSEVIDGCGEIIRYIPDYEDVQHILEDSKSKIAETKPSVEESTQQQEQANVATEEKKEEKAKEDEEYKGGVADDERVLSAIGYLSFLCILPLLLKDKSKYCKHHGKQGLVLAIIFFLYRFVGMLAFLPFLEYPIRLFVSIGQILWLVIIVLAIIQALRGNMWKMPVVYGMSKRLKF